MDLKRIAEECGFTASEAGAFKSDLERFAAAVLKASLEPVYAVATGEVSESGRETYTLHDQRVPMCDQEVLFRTRQWHQAEIDAGSARGSEIAAAIRSLADKEG